MGFKKIKTYFGKYDQIIIVALSRYPPGVNAWRNYKVPKGSSCLALPCMRKKLEPVVPFSSLCPL